MYFYLPDFSLTSLSGTIAEHMFVCRVKSGQAYEVTDLKGRLGTIQILAVDKKQKSINFKVLKSRQYNLEKQKILFQAITDKLYLEKLVEIAPIAGITKIIMFRSQRSPKTNFDQSRLSKILSRSCLQCENIWLPEITFVDDDKLIELLKKTKPYLLDSSSQQTLSEKNNLSLLVGPEGGFNEEEIQRWNRLGLNSLSLGGTVYPAWLAGSAGFMKFS